MDPLIDETGLIVIDIFTRPTGEEIIVQGRTAFRAATAGFPAKLLHDRRNRLQLLHHDQAANLVMTEVGTAADRFLGGCRKGVAQLPGEQALHKARTGPAGA